MGAKWYDHYPHYLGAGLTFRNGHWRAFHGRAAATGDDDVGGRGGDNALGARAMIGRVVCSMDGDLEPENTEPENQPERQKATQARPVAVTRMRPRATRPRTFHVASISSTDIIR
jgi:hypothetical protein